MEKEALKSLPTQRYELRSYKIATVQKNCHVYYSVDNNYYSVPYAFIGKKVKMILTQSLVEIYQNQTRIALHARSRKAYEYVTIKEHMPQNQTYNSGWNPEYFITRAEKMGPSVKECIEIILERKQYAEQNYKSCMGILNFAPKTGNYRLNNACKRALKHQAIGYSHIKNILERGLDKEEEQPDLFTVSSHENIRGADYYS